MPPKHDDNQTALAISRRAIAAGLGAAVLGAAGLGARGLPLSVVWLLPSTAAADMSALALIMVDDPNCSYCRKFDAEIGKGYPRSRYAAAAPLVRIRRKSPELKAYNPVIYTPTFLLVRRDQELGRITGYPGVEYFFAELDGLLAQAGVAPGIAPAVTPPQRGTART